MERLLPAGIPTAIRLFRTRSPRSRDPRRKESALSLRVLGEAINRMVAFVTWGENPYGFFVSIPTITTHSVPFRFISVSMLPGHRWRRSGEGTAEMQLQVDRLWVKEKGIWRDADADKQHDFQKVFQFDRIPEGLAYRKTSPDGLVQELLTLIPACNGMWASSKPHRCGDDVYRAEVKVEAEELHVTWHSQGPEKDYRLHTTYPIPSAIHSWFRDQECAFQ